ncbi:hypothetical protein QUN99_003370 [Vibrio parahaemolyticus]|nr:hypothetical protein [Vibrio parahaemolyticus]
MIKPVLWISFVVMSGFVVAQPLSGTACVPDSGNRIVDEITAKALAKGQLSHELGVNVKATTQVKSTITESIGVAETHDIIIEEVTLKSQHKVKHLATVESGYQQINDERFYCVEVQAKP